MRKLKVAFFQRKPYQSGNYSLEFIFNDIRNRLVSKIDAKVCVSRFYSNGVFRRIFNLIEALFRQGDVNIVTGDIHYVSIFLKKRRTILTILDCGFMYDSRGFIRWIQGIIWLKIPVARVQYVVAISESTKKDIVKFTKCNPEKIIVIPVAISEQYKPHARKVNKKPVLLQIGQADNKNLSRIIKAISGLPVHLSILGNISCDNLRLLSDNKIDYSNSVNVSDEEVFDKYIECDVLVFPSIFEGFGMPILEAQAVGRPVITSNTSSMPWVAGNAAYLVDPLSIDSIRRGVVKVISNKEVQDELISKGLVNVKRFDPGLISTMYLDLFNKLNKGER